MFLFGHLLQVAPMMGFKYTKKWLPFDLPNFMKTSRLNELKIENFAFVNLHHQ